MLSVAPLPDMPDEAIVESSDPLPLLMDTAPFAFFVFISAPVLNSIIFVRFPVATMPSETHLYSNSDALGIVMESAIKYVRGEVLLASRQLDAVRWLAKTEGDWVTLEWARRKPQDVNTRKTGDEKKPGISAGFLCTEARPL